MQVYCVIYQLNEPYHDYQALTDEIEQLGNAFYCMDNSWLLSSVSSAQEIYERLLAYVNTGDRLLVFAASPEFHNAGFDQYAQKWLNRNWQLPKIKSFGL
jgi:hypothetical protein